MAVATFASQLANMVQEGDRGRWSRLKGMAKRSKSAPRAVQMPDWAVCGTTIGGHRHIAISIPHEALSEQLDAHEAEAPRPKVPAKSLARTQRPSKLLVVDADCRVQGDSGAMTTTTTTTTTTTMTTASRSRRQLVVRERKRRDVEAMRRAEALEQARRETRDQARREEKDKMEQETTGQARRGTREQVGQEAKEQVGQEAKEQARRGTREQVGQEAKEQARREEKEQARQEARDQARQEAKEQARQEAKEQVGQEAKEQARQEARDQARREEKKKVQQETRAEMPKQTHNAPRLTLSSLMVVADLEPASAKPARPARRRECKASASSLVSPLPDNSDLATQHYMCRGHRLGDMERRLRRLERNSDMCLRTLLPVLQEVQQQPRTRDARPRW
ncbi:hypothetical protein CDD81_7393 [Ophiocordyceps australis]|uniref:Uncharacterized protein n=1 Tax=Ophiocordyceps australis TaxID=1399860 RepID=A0A2C5XLD5_9HYPO|nr:hypothetical protein CDD81_7393 [Ophiocordyceps australis]